MILETVLLLACLTLLMYSSAYFSSAEIAITTLSNVDVGDMLLKNEKNARYVDYLWKNIEDTLALIALANNVVNFTISSVSTALAIYAFGELGIAIAIGVVTFVVLEFGEITPKAYASLNAERVAKKRAKTIYYMLRGLNPLVQTLLLSGKGMIKLFGGKTERDDEVVTEDDIKTMATLGAKDGTVEAIEEEIIHRVFKFGDVFVKDVMIPRSKVFTLGHKATIRRAKRAAVATGHSRIPVIDRKAKRVVGVLYSKDLIGKNPRLRVEKLIRKPFMVRETTKAALLFGVLKEKRVHLAIVRNRRSKMVGIVTLEDLLEEIVGEILDEYDPEEET